MEVSTPLQPGRKLLLSKSRFIAAYDCPVRLMHSREKMQSTKADDDFLHLLAEGGLQFESLVRHAYAGREFERVIGEGDGAHDDAMAALRAAVESGEGILHEPTFITDQYRVRIDMLRVRGNRIELCEIKAKSFAGPVGGWDGGDLLPVDYPDADGDPQILGKRGAVDGKWVPYVADVGFQLIVLERVLIEAGFNCDQFDIVPCMVLVNKRACSSDADVRGNVLVEADERGVVADDRGMKEWEFKTAPEPGWRSPLIVMVDVSIAVLQLRTGAKSKAARWANAGLDDMMADAGHIYCGSERVDPCTERGWKCRDCEYNARGGDADGFDRCWGDGAGSARKLTTLYYGSSYDDPTGGKGGRWVHLRIDADLTGKTLGVADLDTEVEQGARASRRTMQMQAERAGVPIIGEGLKQAVEDQLRPKSDEAVLWFIDFETSASCLPHYVGGHPYQVVPFQFSCHGVPVRGGEPHWSETKHDDWLFKHDDLNASSLEVDRTFADELIRALTQPVAGIRDAASSVFHWATHERTVLKQVRARLKAATDSCDDARITFLDSMVGKGDQKTGGRLTDMLKLAEDNVFHHLQKGRFSIKQFLPAICSDGDIRSMVRVLVPEIGKGQKAAIGAAWDPYKGLPPIGKVLGGAYKDLVEGDAANAFDGDSMSSGTDAMRAFVSLRYGADGTGRTWNEQQKQELRTSLLAYCKLDTAAMVAVWRWIDGLV